MRRNKLGQRQLAVSHKSRKWGAGWGGRNSRKHTNEVGGWITGRDFSAAVITINADQLKSCINGQRYLGQNRPLPTSESSEGPWV